jgi:hypothetical protein
LSLSIYIYKMDVRKISVKVIERTQAYHPVSDVMEPGFPLAERMGGW